MCIYIIYLKNMYISKSDYLEFDKNTLKKRYKKTSLKCTKTYKNLKALYISIPLAKDLRTISILL